MNRKPTLEQLVRQKLKLDETLKQENQRKTSSTFSFAKIKTQQQINKLQKLNALPSSNKNISFTLGIFILFIISVSSIYLFNNTNLLSDNQPLLTGAVTGIPLPPLSIKSIGTNDDLASVLDRFDNGIDNTKYYNGTNNFIIMHSQQANNLNNGILINGTVSNTPGNATLTTAKNITLNVFNVSVTINLSDTSLTLVGNSQVAASLTVINQSDTTKYFKCEVTLNSAGQYNLQIKTGIGIPPNESSVTKGAGTLRASYDNSTQIITCDFDGSSISYPTTNVGEEYGIQLEGSISFAGFGNPAGSINLTFDNFNYTATKRGPQCGILATNALLKENLETTAGNCFNITASHVTLDCQGYTISYGDDAVDLQLVNPGGGNVTIKNCIFNQNIKSVTDSQAIRSYGGFFNNTFWNNSIYSYSNVGAITIWNNNNTNISYNTIIQNGSYTGNGSGMDIQQSYNTWLDNNIVNTTAVGSNAISYTTGNATIRGNILNTTAVNANALSLNSMIQGTTVSENTLLTSTTGGIGLSSTPLSITASNNLLIRANRIKALGSSNDAFDLDTVNNSLIDNNSIENNAVSAFNGALALIGITANNILVNNNISAPQSGNEIQDSFGMGTDTTYYNYLIYNNSFGEITWQNNGTGGFLRTLTISVSGSLNLGETIFIGNNTAAVNTSAFTPVQMINSSANITLYGLDLATVGEIRKVYNFTTNSTEIKNAGIDCNATGACSILSYSANTLRFNTTGFSSFSANLSAPITFSNTRPSAPAYLQIDFRNLTATTNRTPIFIWQNATDVDGDIFSYHIEVDDNALFNNPEINITAIAPTSANANTTYYAQTTLNVDTRYFWRVRANDSTGYGSWSNGATVDGPSSNSNLSNFTVQSLLQLSLTNNKVEFGAQTRGANISSASSASDNILPFRGENTGNIYVNITLNATALFSSVNMNTSNYQFRIAENESNSFSLALSSLSWTDMTLKTSAFHLVNLSWENIKNDFLVDLNISLPYDESAGLKASTIQFTVTSNQ